MNNPFAMGEHLDKRDVVKAASHCCRGVTKSTGMDGLFRLEDSSASRKLIANYDYDAQQVLRAKSP